MKELLKKWAALEPDRCRLEDWPGGKRILILSPYGWQLVIDEEEPEGYFPNRLFAEAFTQHVVQQAIIARGWAFSINYDPESPDRNNPYDATVTGPTSEGWGFGNDGIASPLLTAYLETLEGEVER